MGWPQTRDAPTQRDGSAAEDDQSIETISRPISFIEAAALRMVFVMTDELLRHGLIHVLSTEPGVRLVGDLAHGPGLADVLAPMRPQLLVVGAEAGSDLSTWLLALDPTPKVLAVIDGEDPRERALPLIWAGADAVVDRRSSSAELRTAVARMLEGHRTLDVRSAETVIDELREQADPGHTGSLTRREREVLELLVDGMDNRAIAGALFISEATVKFHLHNIKSKFGVHSRAALVAMVLRARDHG